MEGYSVYQDIAERSGGDVYIGVVGPVRTGKSTFIKKFMDLLVIPNIENKFQRERACDELPQSAGGRTIMTTEPKFIPNEAVEIGLGDNARLKVRMIDCVGYIVNSSLGYIEEDEPRMVNTPWYDHPIPFHEAAELGTKKVITEHSTIGLVVTTDGSISEIPREDYIDAEDRVINELKAINKPFIIILNTVSPDSSETEALRCQLEEKHNVPVMPVNCAELDVSDISAVIETILFEFPVREIRINTPSWMTSLGKEHWLNKELYEAVKENCSGLDKIRSVKTFSDTLSQKDNTESCVIAGMDLGYGNVTLELNIHDSLYYQILGERTGYEIKDKNKLLTLLEELSHTKKEYERIEEALNEVKEKGYGIVSPSTDELSLAEPKIVKQGGRFGVKLKASAPSIHMIRADIETEVSPIVGSEKQSEELVHYLLEEFESDPSKIWESNIFGKSLFELVSEGLHNKLARMPDESRSKMRETLERVINEGSGGLICIIL